MKILIFIFSVLGSATALSQTSYDEARDAWEAQASSAILTPQQTIDATREIFDSGNCSAIIQHANKLMFISIDNQLSSEIRNDAAEEHSIIASRAFDCVSSR